MLIGLGLGREAEAGVAGIAVFVLRVPLLRIGRIRDDGIEVERVVGIDRVLIVEERPIVFQGVGVAGDDIAGKDAAHDEVHAREVIGVFFQLLNQAAKGREGIAHMGDIEVAFVLDPGGKQVLVADEVTKITFNEGDRLCVVFGERANILYAEVLTFCELL